METVRVVDDEQQQRELDQGLLQLLPPRLRVTCVGMVGNLIHGPRVIGNDDDVDPGYAQQVAHDVLGQIKLFLHVPHAVAQGPVLRRVHEPDDLARLLRLRDGRGLCVGRRRRLCAVGRRWAAHLRGLRQLETSVRCGYCKIIDNALHYTQA